MKVEKESRVLVCIVTRDLLILLSSLILSNCKWRRKSQLNLLCWSMECCFYFLNCLRKCWLKNMPEHTQNPKSPALPNYNFFPWPLVSWIWMHLEMSLGSCSQPFWTVVGCLSTSLKWCINIAFLLASKCKRRDLLDSLSFSVDLWCNCCFVLFGTLTVIEMFINM